MKKMLIALLFIIACQQIKTEEPAGQTPAMERYEEQDNQEDFLNEIAAEVRQIEHERSDTISLTWQTLQIAAIAAWYMCVIEPYHATVNYCNRIIKKMLS